VPRKESLPEVASAISPPNVSPRVAGRGFAAGSALEVSESDAVRTSAESAAREATCPRAESADDALPTGAGLEAGGVSTPVSARVEAQPAAAASKIQREKNPARGTVVERAMRVETSCARSGR
jgi:hypothetical protein